MSTTHVLLQKNSVLRWTLHANQHLTHTKRDATIEVCKRVQCAAEKESSGLGTCRAVNGNLAGTEKGR